MKFGSGWHALVLSVDGKAGHERQAIAVAERLLPTEILRLSRRLQGRAPRTSHDLPLDHVALVVAAGRQAIAPARRILHRTPRPVVAVLQPVFWRARAFDLIWFPQHDRGRAASPPAPNELQTLTTPSPLRPEDCRLALQEHGEFVACGPSPRIGVLVGGPSRTHRFGALEADELGARLAAFGATHQASLLVATSPRTTPTIVARLRERLAGLPYVLIDYRHTPNPSSAYAAILAAASSLIVTSDSIAMMSEAASTGKPIHGWRLPGGKAKYETFYRGLEAHGALRWFDGHHHLWTYEPLDAASIIAARLAPMLGLPPPA